jgi:uncharacterized protein YjbI with pentapeptide repeats
VNVKLFDLVEWAALIIFPLTAIATVTVVTLVFVNLKLYERVHLRLLLQRILGKGRTSPSREQSELVMLQKAHSQLTTDIAEQSSQDAEVQAYLGQVGELLIKGNLHSQTEDADTTAYVQDLTLRVLNRVGAAQKGSVLMFLSGAGLIQKARPIVSLLGANLSGANLSYFDLNDTDLSGANMHRADLHSAQLASANLNQTNLMGTDLRGAYLVNANLEGADLRGADVRAAQFDGARLSFTNLMGGTGTTAEELERVASSLQGATMPDGSKHSYQ